MAPTGYGTACLETGEVRKYPSLSQDMTRLVYVGREDSARGFSLMVLEVRLMEDVVVKGDYTYGATIMPDEPVSYTILSYRYCGDSNGDEVAVPITYISAGREVQVNPIRISTYLSRAFPNMMRSLGLKHGFYAWIDDICIDHISPQERDDHAVMKPRLYTNASGINVYLGPPTHDSETAMMKITEAMESGVQKERFDAVAGFWSAVDQAVNDDYDSCQWRSVYTLIRRPWFCRAQSWIEIAWAPADKVNLYCGKWSLNFQRQLFALAVALWDGMPDNLSTKQQYVQQWLLMVTRVRTMSEAYTGETKSKRVSILDIASNVSIWDFDEAEDKLWSIIQFAQANYTLKAPPSLSHSPVELNTYIALCCIDQSRDLKVLGYGPNASHSRNTVQSPSWAPDWSIPCIAPLCKFSHLFNPCGKEHDAIQIATPWPNDPKLLHIRGKRITSVESVTNLNLTRPINEEDIATYCGGLQPNHVCPRNGMSYREVFLRTLHRDSKYIDEEPEGRYERLRKDDQFFEPGHTPLIEDQASLTGRRLFFTTPTTTAPRLMGVGPHWNVPGATLLPGDEIWMLQGGDMVYALREVEDEILETSDWPLQAVCVFGDEHHRLLRGNNVGRRAVRRLVGECFVLGMMDGEEINADSGIVEQLDDVYLM